MQRLPEVDNGDLHIKQANRVSGLRQIAEFDLRFVVGSSTTMDFANLTQLVRWFRWIHTHQAYIQQHACHLCMTNLLCELSTE